MRGQNSENMIFFFLYYLISTVSSSSTIDCFVESKKCAILDQNLIETHVSVSTMEECSVLCNDNVFCTAFTYFRLNSVFVPNACLLFSSCSKRESCEDCVSGTVQYECDCGIEFEGIVDKNNFVDLVPNVAEESSCKNLCARNDECDVYTYYDDQDSTKPNMCFLLTSKGLQQPVTLCDHCKTGPGRCETGQKCQVAVIVNYRTAETQAFFLQESTTVYFAANEKDCFHNITMLAIGGGGGGNYAGGGSGYVEMKNVTVVSNADNSVPLVVSVGGPGYSSYVTLGDEIILQALQGENAAGNLPMQDKDVGGDGLQGENAAEKGGDGYSGGGGSGGHGGSDGGNGEDGGGTGGKGSGLNIELMALANFLLTPAEGGNIQYDNVGGGGGGVLVNGLGPDNHMRGFGGGGEYRNENGNAGCILIEL